MQLIERPAAEKRKIHSANEFELCYIRHQYFRKVKFNPTAEDMAPYKKIVAYLAHRTYYKYAVLFHIVGMNIDDVVAVGNINLVNFIGLFEISKERNTKAYEDFCEIFKNLRGKKPIAQDLLGKNKANLTMFMKQRMEDLVRICRQKAKNIRGTRVDESLPFHGRPKPPEDLRVLLIDNEAYGYYKCDMNLYRAYKKRIRAKNGDNFFFAGEWYVAVPLDHRPISWEDLAGAGLDPHDGAHNMTPEEIVSKRESEIAFDKQVRKYKNSSKEEKTQTILDFIEKYENNPKYYDEIRTAKSMLKRYGYR